MKIETKHDKNQFNIWVKALRSGEYAQTTQKLETSDGFCCLGVACKVLIPETQQKIGYESYRLMGQLPDDQTYAPKWLKLIDSDFANRTGRLLTQLNDNDGMTFNEIADLLEAIYIHQVLED